MSRRGRARARWLAPAIALTMIACGVALAQTAGAAEPLPPRTAEQLLVDLHEAEPTALSGTISDTVNLGLPALPASMSSGDTDAMSLLSGEHTWRIWTDGAEKSRLALIADSAETNIVRTGDDVWLWSSTSQTATHTVLSDEHATDKRPDASATPTDLPRTPAEAAQWALAAIDPTTQVSTAGTATVAGRAAYELVLTPRDSASRVASVRLAIDAERHLPLRVQVFSTKSSAAAIDLGFSSIDFATPDPSVFSFTPPPGASVVQKDPAEHSGAGKDGTRAAEPQPAAAAEPTVTGTGWTTIVSGRMGSDTGRPATGPGTEEEGGADTAQELAGLFPTVSGSWGSGKVFDGTLFSIVLTDDGRYAAGAVAPDALYAALPPA